MTSPMTPDTWVPNKPLVLFMVPQRYTMVYAALMQKLAIETLAPEDVELIGFISHDNQSGAASLYYLRESNIDPLCVTGLVLWGESGDHLGFHSSTDEECLPGSVIIPESSVSIPTLCLPSIDIS